MPTADTLARFIARVEQGAHVEAIQEYYHLGATMQENTAAPRVGLEALVANEARVLSRVKSVVSKCVGPVFVNGDHVGIRCTFKFEGMDGGIRELKQFSRDSYFFPHQQHIGWIFPVGDGGNAQAIGLTGRQVFHRMDRKVNISAQQGVFDFFGKKPFPFHFVEGEVLNLIALRFDDHEFHLGANRPERLAGVFCLPKRQFTPSCANSNNPLQIRNFRAKIGSSPSGANEFLAGRTKI